MSEKTILESWNKFRKVTTDNISQNNLDWSRPSKGKFRKANWDTARGTQSSGETHKCGLCGEPFPTLGALHEHKQREHKRSDGSGTKTYDTGG